MAKVLMKGNEAIGEAALRAGCRYFFGYPITPQSEVPEYLAKRMPEVGGTFVQAESEVASINMLYGAAGTGERVMTSSSSPGISLMAEGTGRYKEEHGALVLLLNEPFAVAMVNAMKHQEVLKLKDMLADDNRYFQQELLRI